MRDGRLLDHQAHVFAFIADDLVRMLSPAYYGFGKPLLELDGGRLVAHNVPVPRTAYIWPWLTSQRHHLQQLRSYTLVSELLRRVRPAPQPPSVDDFLALVFAAFEDLQAVNRQKGSGFLIAYLPTYPECLPGADPSLRRRLSSECTRRHLAFVDLTTTFAALPAGLLDQMYLPGPLSSRHLSASGHLLVAETLRPYVAGMLETSPGTSESKEEAAPKTLRR
jgi:hypothetical protein